MNDEMQREDHYITNGATYDTLTAAMRKAAFELRTITSGDKSRAADALDAAREVVEAAQSALASFLLSLDASAYDEPVTSDVWAEQLRAGLTRAGWPVDC